MSKVKYFLVTYDKLLDKAVNNLSENEIQTVTCYNIQKSIPKQISSKVLYQLNEWDLLWNDFSYQKKQYYEYGAMIHLYKNQDIIQDITHIGLLHYDIVFEKNSITDVEKTLQEDPNIIFYQMKRNPDQLSLLEYEFKKLCEYMSTRLDTIINPTHIMQSGWYSECMSVTPKPILLRFGEFLFNYGKEIEQILKNNIWGIMDHCPHRICGIIERMWGFYLMSLPNEKQKLNITHDWNSYNHHHMKYNGTGIANINL